MKIRIKNSLWIFDLRVTQKELQTLGQKVSCVGLTFPAQRWVFVCRSLHQSVSDYRFTVFHELFHAICAEERLSNCVIADYGEGLYYFTRTPFHVAGRIMETEEVFADRFANYMLSGMKDKSIFLGDDTDPVMCGSRWMKKVFLKNQKTIRNVLNQMRNL